MKRIGNLWNDLISFENLYHAYQKARRGKRGQRSVERFEFHREVELIKLQQELTNETYCPGNYRTFMLYDTKPRMISAAPFRDRIVHHALCNILEPIFERTFIYDSYASRKGKGTHAAIARYQQFARQNAYVLKCDVKQFFPSVDHQILKDRIFRKVKDVAVLNLVKQIIDNSNIQTHVSGFFPEDDLFTSVERRKGIPIGNQTSQFFGNVYLDALDHFIKESLRCRSYVRYVDDFVILDNDKTRLAKWRDEIAQFLIKLRLWLHPKKRVISRTCDGVRFLGFRVWPQRIWLTKDYLRRVRKRFRRYQLEYRQGIMSQKELTQRIQAWLGHVKTISAERYLDDILYDIIFERMVT
tara:strand:- start:6714 stop:7778 length:1065 start_codon:yes stop_codon:yes gene_type:complete